jgi:hypothetical protein
VLREPGTSIEKLWCSRLLPFALRVDERDERSIGRARLSS